MLKLKSKVGIKGQVVIPKAIRDSSKIYPGQEVYFTLEGDKIVIAKKSAGEILEEFINAIKPKLKEPEKIDWDKEYYSQFED